MDTTEKQMVQQKQKHPKGLYLLFITEMWERYSYYGMRAVLVLYLTTQLIQGGLGMDEEWALMLYGIYTGLVYFTPMIGGWLTDKIIGLRTAITIGGITMATGDFMLFLVNNQVGLYTGLALLTIGNGFFKPNISTLVGELYDKNDIRKDSGFTIFYMGINLGALFSPLVAGLLYQQIFGFEMDSGLMHYGYKYAFLASSMGMIIGQIIFNLGSQKFLGDIGKKPAMQAAAEKNPDANKAKPLTKGEKQRTKAILILACFVVFFWAGFEQAGSSFTLYTQHFVDRTIFGFEIPTAWFASVNPLFILILAPFVSALWYGLARRNKDLKIPTKMAFGMILLGIGFMVLLPAVMMTGSDETDVTTKASLLFIVVTYLCHTLGELFLSPVGLSMVSKTAPLKIASLLMGVWMASIGVANFLSGWLASFTASLGYLEIFFVIGATAIVLGIVLLTISKKLSHMMTQE